MNFKNCSATLKITLRNYFCACSFRTKMAVTDTVEIAHSTFTVCPRCGTSLDREYMAYCDCCGQALNWKYF